MKNKIHFSKFYFAGLLLTFLLFFLGGRQAYVNIVINYAQDPTGEAVASVLRGEEVVTECRVTEGIAELYFQGTDFTGISPVHYDSHEKLYLANLKIRIQGIPVYDLKPEMILEKFTLNSDIRYGKLTPKGLEIETRGAAPGLELSPEFSAELQRLGNFAGMLNFLLYALVYSILYWYLFKVVDICHDFGPEKFMDAVLGLVAIGALLLSWGIAFESGYGGTIHPDEMQTRAAVEYYRTHWIQPDVRSDLVAGTVSGYGMTRLSEINLYYLFAGKFANFFTFEMSFRSLGMFLFLVLVCFVLKNMKEERYLGILLFATPQLWYLFSYATSDAFDYFFTVAAVYELLSKRSALHRILREGFHWRQSPAYLGVGFVFANLLMAKKTFYVVLLLSFLLLLYRLFFAETEKRKALFLKYLAILMTAFAIVFVRYAPDFGYYGLQKSTAVHQVMEETALPEYKPSTPAVLQAKSTLLHEKGVTLKEFFTEWGFNRELFKNYFGYYGIYSLEAKAWYYTLMGALYVALFAVIGGLVHKKIKEKEMQGRPTGQMRLTYWTMWGMIGLMYLLTVYNAYFVDFQPQGRYLFPALPAVACQMSLDRGVGEHRAVRILLTAIGVLSLYSFYKIAYLNF